MKISKYMKIIFLNYHTDKILKISYIIRNKYILDSIKSLILFEAELIIACNKHINILYKNTNHNYMIGIEEKNFILSIAKINEYLIAVGGKDCKIKIYDFINNLFIKEYLGHSDYITSVIKIDDYLFASCSYDKLIKVWDSKTFTNYKTLQGHKRKINQ